MSLDSSSNGLSLSASAETLVTFPPSKHVDFVLHYGNTAFHVHKLVLHHHSAYFRTYLDTLPAPSRSKAKKRKKAFPAAASTRTSLTVSTCPARRRR